MNKINGLKQKKGMPEYGVEVNLHGSDYMGDWVVKGFLLPYKSKPFKNSPPHRFVNTKGEQIKHVEGWAPLHQESKK